MPVPVGAVFTTSHLLVTDTFGMTLSLAPAAHAQTGGGRAEGAGRWTMFLSSLADGTAVADAFVLPASAVQRLTSRPVETYTCCATRRQTSHGRSGPWWKGRTAWRGPPNGSCGRSRHRRPPVRCGTG